MTEVTTGGSEVLKRNFARNTGAATLFELLWGLGMPFCTLMAVVPLYLLHLGASKLLVQSVLVGLQLFTLAQLFSGRVCAGPRRKLRNIGLWCIFSGIWLGYSLAALFLWDLLPREAWVGVFVLAVLGLGAIVHLANPVYSEVLLENIPKRRRGLVNTLRRVALGAAGMGGVTVTRWLMANWEQPFSFHLRFLIGGSIFMVGCSSYLLFKDVSAPKELVPETGSVLEPLKKLFSDMNFRTFLVFQMLIRAASSLMPLMLGYGRDVLGLPPAEREYFILAFFLGMIAVGLSVPVLADRFGFKAIAVINAGLLLVAFVLPVFAWNSAAAAFASYGLYAGSAGLTMMVMANLGAELVPGMRPATVIAVGSTLAMPLSLGLAPIGGWLVDAHGDAGYLCAFVVGAALSLCALVGLVLIVREPRTGQELFVRIRKL